MKFGIYPNLGKKDLKMALERLTALLRDKNIDYSLPLSMKKGLMDMGFTEDTYETDESMGKRDFILSVGGDGSFLGAARAFRDYPVLMAGLHLGDLGFLNSMTLRDMEKRVDQILSGDYQEEHRLYLSAVLIHGDGRKEKLPTVLNDVVIGHASIGQLARIRLFINDSFIQEYAADGLIIHRPPVLPVIPFPAEAPCLGLLMTGSSSSLSAPTRCSVLPWFFPGMMWLKSLYRKEKRNSVFLLMEPAPSVLTKRTLYWSEA